MQLGCALFTVMLVYITLQPSTDQIDPPHDACCGDFAPREPAIQVLHSPDQSPSDFTYPIARSVIDFTRACMLSFSFRLAHR